MGSSLLVLSCRARAMQRGACTCTTRELGSPIFRTRKQRGKSTQRTRAFHRLGPMPRCSQGGIRFAAAALVSMCASQLLVHKLFRDILGLLCSAGCAAGLQRSPATLDVLSEAPKLAVAAETRDQNGQHWGSPLSVRYRFCRGQRRLLEAPERRDQADDRCTSRRALRRCASAAAAAAADRDACSGTRACDGIVVLAASET